MTLASQSWSPVSINDVVAAFLRAERDKLPGPLTQEWTGFVDGPDISDPVQNHFRLRLLYSYRLLLMVEVPPDTAWYLVRDLTDAGLKDLLVIDRCDLIDPAGSNELGKATPRLPLEPLHEPPSAWAPLILWGHSKDGPFTILEGNHRLMAYAAAEKRVGLGVPVIVGLSTMPCFWHRPDPAHKLGNDLITRTSSPFSW